MDTKYLTIKALVYFLYNFPPYREVIGWIAEHQTTCNKQHLFDKIEECFNHSNSSVEAWTRFYLELTDGDIRQAFTDYVCHEYSKRMRLSDEERALLK